MYKAELISIGNELLSGRTLNSHARDLGQTLTDIGLHLTRDTTIPDSMSIIGEAMTEAFSRVDLVFISGGLGPTVDDITRDALSRSLNQRIVLDQDTVKVITDRYTARGRVMTPAAERQALVLENAVVLPNSAGAAPGQRIDLPENKTLFILPGPPNEFNAILKEEIIPWLSARYPEARPDIVLSIWSKGIFESDIATLLENEGVHPANVDLGFYPANGQVEIRITAQPDHQTEAENAQARLQELLADYLIKHP